MSRNLYQNLDTAFVNLPAMIRYLCSRGFVGQINVAMSSYEAEILVNGDEPVEICERDLMTGRIADGEEAMQRLLIRAREAGGIINVVQKDSFEIAAEAERFLRPEPQIPVVQVRETAELEAPLIEIEVEGSEYSKAPVQSQQIPIHAQEAPMTSFGEQPLNDDDWMNLLKLTVDLLASVDRSLGLSGLEFSAAFAKASSELTEDYPFLRGIEYSNARLTIGTKPPASMFVNGVMEVLRRVMGRLGSNPQFTELHQRTTEKLVDLVHHNKNEYDRYAVTSPLYRVLGINSYSAH